MGAMLPQSLRKTLERQENQMALGIAWIVLPVVATLAGFYLGTFVASEHTIDIQGADIQKGLVGAVIGLACSVLFAIGVSVLYPKAVERDYAARAAKDEEHLAHIRKHGATPGHH